MENTQHEEQGRTRDERAAVCRAIAGQFGLPEADFAGDVSLVADWPGEVPEGAIVLVRTGKTLPAGGPEEVAQSWMKVNDRLEEAGIGLYCEVKSDMLTRASASKLSIALRYPETSSEQELSYGCCLRFD